MVHVHHGRNVLMPFRTSRSAPRRTPVVLNASGKAKDLGDPRHERRAAATAALGDSDIQAIGRRGSAAAAHSSMRSKWSYAEHTCTTPVPDLRTTGCFFIGLLVLFIFYEISLLLGTIRDLISEPLSAPSGMLKVSRCALYKSETCE